MTMQVPGNQTQTPAAPEQGQPQAPAGQAVVLTQEQLAALKAEIVNEAFQRAQSYVDRGANKIRERMTEMEKTLAAANVTLDQGQRQAMEQAIKAQVMAEPDTPTSPTTGAQPARIAPPQPAQAAQTQGMDPITAAAYEIMQEQGVTLEDGDPEIAMLSQESPRKYLQSVEAAIAAKKQRTSNQPTNNRPAPVPGAGYGGQPASPYAGQKGFDLISQHYAARKK